MKAQLIRIGNEQCIRIPKPMIQECGFGKTVEITVENSRLVISPVPPPRHEWESAFRTMAENGDDQLLIDDIITHSWDEEEWK